MIHQEQLGKVEHLHAVAKATGEIYAKSQEDKIKNLQKQITVLKTNAKQCDKIAQTATTTTIGLNAFNKRAKTRKLEREEKMKQENDVLSQMTPQMPQDDMGTATRRASVYPPWIWLIKTLCLHALISTKCLIVNVGKLQ